MSRKESEDTLKSLKELQGSQELIEMSMKEISKLLFSKYQSLVKSGFTEIQALEIIKVRGLE